jgi:hypothetical protein
MRRDASGLRDRVLAAIEVPALGIWLGTLIGFAFVSAPLAFRIVAPLDVGRFAALTAQTLAALTVWGYVLGGLAIVAAVLRAATAGDRTWDAVRIALVAAALGLATYENQAIVPAMAATTDVRSADYHALHQRSTQVYGAVVLFGIVALVLAASRREDA